MSPQRYRLSFTTGGLFLQEAPVVAERYLVVGNWQATRDQVRSENLLQVCLEHRPMLAHQSSPQRRRAAMTLLGT